MIRFKKFGMEMAKKFQEKPQHQANIRALFGAQNDKLSYFNLFYFIEHELKIKLQNWEEDGLEGRLDRLGMAFIEFNEFNEFCMPYGIDFQEDLLETDMEDILDQKINTSYHDYRVTKKDWFNGCPTMVTSEKAALALVEGIWENHKLKQSQGQNVGKYVDPDFGPKRPSDIQGSAMSMYKTGDVPRKGYTEPAKTQWVFAESLCDPGEVPQFVDDGVASADCIQGNIGDCWFISAMSVLATRDELLVGGRRGMELDEDMIVDKEIAAILSNGVYPPIFHKYRAIGLYVIRVYKNFQWIYVIADERVPVHTEKGKKYMQPVFGHCKDPHELWVAIIEKAYAKLHGCYENLISGYVDEGVQELTGMQPEKIFIKNESTGVFPHRMVEANYGGAEGFWAFLKERRNDNCLLGCSIKGNGKEGELQIEGKSCGLILNHAYSINDIIEFPDRYDKSKKGVIRLLRLRNPWGKSEWKFAWADGSKERQAYEQDITDYIASLPPDEQFNPNKNDGTFMMSYNDWKD